jgi:hypothetical protein
LGKEENSSTSPKVTSPKKLERKNLFGNKDGASVSNGGSSIRKRSRILDKSATRSDAPI